MNRINLLWMVLLGCLVPAWMGAHAAEADQSPSIIVHFEPGKASLSAADKAELQRLFQTYALGPQGRVFVVGYADASGTKTENRKLSRQRAEAVRGEIVRFSGIDAGIVLALGKGAEIPVADNKTEKGRALNRRAEIYLGNSQVRRPQRALGPGDPYFSDIQGLVRDAEALIKARQLESALRKLKQAHALGADSDADWHVAMGIAGYYAAAPQQETQAHLAAALNLDPNNSEAREYLSRMEARQKVARGELTKQMGRSPETAIGITTIAQQYEYLRLFEVEPRSHRQMATQPVDIWQCVDTQGAPVVYYFNHSRVYDWAFTRTAAGIASAGAQGAQTRGMEQASPAAPSKAPSPVKIWDSKIFN